MQATCGAVNGSVIKRPLIMSWSLTQWNNFFFSGHIEFTWQQVMIGIQSSVIMFPINLLIVSIFRNTRPRERDTKTITSKQKKTGQVSPSQNSSPQKQMKDITPDTVIKVRKLIRVFDTLLFFLVLNS